MTYCWQGPAEIDVVVRGRIAEIDINVRGRGRIRV